MVEITISIELEKIYTGKEVPVQTANLIYPDDQDAAMPAIILVHGNGLYLNEYKDKSALVEIGKALAWNGFFTMSINYASDFPTALSNCKCAVRFLKAHADKYQLDPNRIGIWGFSNGGHLASLVGTSPFVEALEGSDGWNEENSKVQAACNWFGPTDLSKLDEQHTASLTKYMGGALDKKNVKDVNPITYLAGNTPPPFLIAHSTEDSIVAFEQSQQLFDALKSVNADVEMIMIDGKAHGGDLLKTESPLFQKSFAFFDRKLRG